MILYKNETRLRAHRQNGGGRFFGYAIMERKYSEAEAQFMIDENNWKKYISFDELPDPTVVFENTGGTYVDQQTLEFVKKDV